MKLPSFFTEMKIKRGIKKSSNQSLVDSLRLTLQTGQILNLNESLVYYANQIITELHMRAARGDPEAKEILISELESLCVEKIIPPVLLLDSLVAFELQEEGAVERIINLINEDNLKNWIRFTSATKLNREIVQRITEEDIVRIEEAILKVVVHLT